MEYTFGEAVTVRRATIGTDDYGDPVPASWADLETYPRCAVWPSSSTEVNDNRSAVITSLEMALPAGADVRSTDRLVWRGATYEVIGEPFPWHNPFTGWQPATQVTVQKVTG
jgi:hypothetical protein